MYPLTLYLIYNVEKRRFSNKVLNFDNFLSFFVEKTKL